MAAGLTSAKHHSIRTSGSFLLVSLFSAVHEIFLGRNGELGIDDNALCVKGVKVQLILKCILSHVGQ